MDFLSPEYLKFLDRRGQFSESDIEKVSLFCVGDNDDNDDGMSNGMMLGHPQPGPIQTLERRLSSAPVDITSLINQLNLSCSLHNYD